MFGGVFLLGLTAVLFRRFKKKKVVVQARRDTRGSDLESNFCTHEIATSTDGNRSRNSNDNHAWTPVST